MEFHCGSARVNAWNASRRPGRPQGCPIEQETPRPEAGNEYLSPRLNPGSVALWSCRLNDQPDPEKNASDPTPWVLIAICFLPIMAVAVYFLGFP